MADGRIPAPAAVRAIDSAAAIDDSEPPSVRTPASVLRPTARAVAMVWAHERRLVLCLVGLTIVTAVIPTVSAWVGRGVVDTAAAAALGTALATDVIGWVGIEGVLMLLFMASGRMTTVAQSILGVRFGHRVRRLLLERAQRLELKHFEDSAFYDRLARAQREAGSRPLSAAGRIFAVLRTMIVFVGAAALLVSLSPWAVVALLFAGLPSLIVEAKFSRATFRLLNHRTPEAREQLYLQTLLTREDYVKETKLGGIATRLLSRYDALFDRVYREDRALAVQRGVWGFCVGSLATLTFFGLYGYIAWQAALGSITIGEMTMFLLLVRQGQSAVTAGLGALSGVYDDALFLSNLFTFVDYEPPSRGGGATEGPDPQAGIELCRVSFCYPGASHFALHEVDLQLRPGQSLAIVGANGCGKSTLVKLLTGLHLPTSGTLRVDGLDVQKWDPAALCRRTAVVLQAFARYQFTAGQNIGLGDLPRCDDEVAWKQAAVRSQAASFIEALPRGYHTQVGTWFPGGSELSGGQWQKLALARAFMRKNAKTLVLDEATSALDPEAEAQVFEHVRGLCGQKSVLLISHRFSSVRNADQIVVLDDGRVLERGDHASLVRQAGRYATLFAQQARAYQ